MAAHTNCRGFWFMTISLLCMFSACHGQECLLPGHDMANLTTCIWEFSGTGTQCLVNNSSSTECVFTMKFCSALNLTKNCGNNVSVCEIPDERNVALAGFTAKPFEEFKDAHVGGILQFKNCTALNTLIKVIRLAIGLIGNNVDDISSVSVNGLALIQQTTTIANLVLDTLGFTTEGDWRCERRIGFKTVFPLGSTYTYEDKDKKNVTCRLNTTINFLCSALKAWPMGPSATSTVQVPVPPDIKFTQNGDKCEYNITFEFAGACVMISPSISKDHSLSAGSVLVIMFFVFMIAYFVFGSMWNIGCRGARGKEAIPNFDFWTMLPVYVADGFIFTFRCGQMESSSYDSI